MNDLEATVLFSAFYDLDLDGLSGKLNCQLWPCVAAIGKQLARARVYAQRLLDQVGGAVAILRVGRDHLDCELMAFGVDYGVALYALGLLARIIPNRVDRGLPISGLFCNLVVDDGCRWIGLPAAGPATLLKDRLMDAIERAVVAPFPEVVVESGVRRKNPSAAAATGSRCG